jgi:hypothetical protein
MGNRLRINRRSHDPAQEYLVIVGAPSNTFNGYINDISGVGQPAPANVSEAEILKYISGPDVTTHDLYWADFLYSAVKLVETRRIQPDPGDILTFLIYSPPYLLRESRDWDASPYNLQLHGASPWVAGKYPYDPRVRKDDQGKVKPKPRPTEPNGRKTPPPPPSKAEPDIDHDILMRTTEEFQVQEDGTITGYLFDGGFPKRVRNVYGRKEFYDIVRRIVDGSRWKSTGAPNVPPLRHVLVKTLYFDDPAQMFTYIQQGTWTGSERLHPDFTPTADWQSADPPPYNWMAARVKDASKYGDWQKTPAVDRSRVKIRRLDYFGHSTPSDAGDADYLFLQYGWTNRKGEAPSGEVVVTDSEWNGHLGKDLFTKDAVAYLWGCQLAGRMAPMLSKFVGDVTACIGRTSYDFILEDYTSMPEPASDDPQKGWKRFIVVE